MVPETLRTELADRGASQWVYGELTNPKEILSLLRSHSLHTDLCSECMLDFGSGDGGIVIGVARLGVRSIGVELVPARHANAERALQMISDPSVAARVDFRCEDALVAVQPLSHATLMLCNNAVWEDDLNARVAAAVGEHAVRLCAFATTKKLPTAAVHASGLTLERTTTASVDWNPSGWPLYIYCRTLHCPPRHVSVDPAFFGAAAFAHRRLHMVEVASSSAAEAQAASTYRAISAACERTFSSDAAPSGAHVPAGPALEDSGLDAYSCASIAIGLCPPFEAPT